MTTVLLLLEKFVAPEKIIDVQEKLQKLVPSDVVIKRPEELIPTQFADVEITIGWTATGNKILEQPNHKLKWVQTYSAGFDYLPLATFEKEGVKVSNASGISAGAIAESAVGMLLGIVRDLYQAYDDQKKHEWQKKYYLDNMPQTIAGKQVLIYGTGHIGQKIAAPLKLFGMQTVGVNHDGHPAENFDVTVDDQTALNYLKTAKVVINIMPLTDQTKKFFNEAFFAKLENHPIFMNFGRGPSVDTNALIAALNSGALKAAAIDVVDPEPLPSDSPLWSEPHAIITPHIAGLYYDYLGDVMKIFLTNLKSFLRDGQLTDREVNLKKGY